MTQHLNEKKQLGQFCDQFGIETSKPKGKQKQLSKKYKKFENHKYYKQNKFFPKKYNYDKKKSQNPPTC